MTCWTVGARLGPIMAIGLLGLVVSIGAPLPRAAADGQITQYFPANAQGQPAGIRESGWRVSWRVLPRGTHTYGASQVWVFDSIEFMKGRRQDGSEDWIKVLNQLAMVEMYVPYNSGTEFQDMQMAFDLADAKPEYLPAAGVLRARIEDRNVISELVEDGVRWGDNQPISNTLNRIRRGQALDLWATLVCANYAYIMHYRFADDGRISVRVSGTSQNLVDLNDLHGDMNNATHGHMGAWRMEFDLGNAATNQVEVYERFIDPARQVGILRHRPFNNGREGGEVWDPDKFTMLKIANPQTLNRHSPPQPVSYAIKTKMPGRLRTGRAFTANDFWVTRRVPDDPRRQARAPENRFDAVPANIANPEPLAGQPVVVWHNVALQHVPHGEDFGPVGYDASEGTAVGHPVGFDLVPVNIWHKTPFLDRLQSVAQNNGTAASRAASPSGAQPTLARLQRGEQGEQVRALQQRLKDRGIAVEIDGNFGRSTEEAVRELQRTNGLPVDGVVGRKTWEKL